MVDKFYANDANVGFEEYDTLEEAKSAAKEMLQSARDACDPEWPDWVESIEYGRLIPLATATETNVRESDPEEDDPEGPEYFCDVELVSQPDELAQLHAELEKWREWARVEFRSRWCAPSDVDDDGMRYAIRLHLAVTDEENTKLESLQKQLAQIEQATNRLITKARNMAEDDSMGYRVSVLVGTSEFLQLESALAKEGETRG